ncbi:MULTISPECIES: lipopolysaccharide assembly protein LapB [unclassified Treponema]|uniref:tetratricopeptide repeat protein n=1 Tax=unclassified Treponema TaxID=2638727 RepID=UPI0020A4B1C8|nr:MULTISPECIES: tetratricopeptide repeat protein [unclassified Treponema]UTC68002.1 tetratricopeptide repeat protein [Treponema sp. OMZ 789]UTC70724.1 tetratricopeptide repeat protein [Treponema sp. OMZ 790]UTC73444.1 tetratricopeptide repeat protein [Treponema sp. OMZ 791]
MKRQIIFVNLVLLLFLIFSCSQKMDEQAFSQALSKIDTQISEGRLPKALKGLKRLSKKASTSTNYVSIVKRQLKLNAVPDALISLQAGIKSFPESVELPALLTYVLTDTGKAAEALPYCDRLKNSSYASLGAEASILADVYFNSFNSDSGLLKAAYDKTKNQVFLKNAAVSLASKGRLREASNLRYAIPQDTAPEHPFFWSCIVYDLGVFDPIFGDLYFSLVYADKEGGSGKLAEKARLHLMLAADAAFGQGDTERARAFWQAAVDRSPEMSPITFYDLALTAPDEKERVDLLIECIDLYPDFYPVIARYIREALALRELNDPDSLTSYLESKGFYSLKMEETYFTSPKMTYLPEELLTRAMNRPEFDPRFILEEFRYKQIKDKTYASKARGKADMWKILEKYGKESTIREYAKWYFAKSGDFNACFSVGDIGKRYEDSFYLGIASAAGGDFESAISEFATSAQIPAYAYASTVNSAYMYYMLGKTEEAVNAYSLASSMTKDKMEQSLLHYEIALIFYEKKAFDRAISVLGYALELNPKNYQAASLIKRLKALN